MTCPADNVLYFEVETNKSYDNPLSVVIYSFLNKRGTEESESEDSTQLLTTRERTRERHTNLCRTAGLTMPRNAPKWRPKLFTSGYYLAFMIRVGKQNNPF